MRFEDALIDVYRNFLPEDKARVFGKDYRNEQTLDILKELGQDEFMKRYEADKEVELNQLDMYSLNHTLYILKNVDEDVYRELQKVKDNIEDIGKDFYGKRKFVYRRDR